MTFVDSRLFAVDSRLLLSTFTVDFYSRLLFTLDFHSQLSTFTLESRPILSTRQWRRQGSKGGNAPPKLFFAPPPHFAPSKKIF